MAERRHDLEYLAAGYLTGVMIQHGCADDALFIPTDDEGTVTGALHFAYAGAWFTITPTLLPPGTQACRGCGCTDEHACDGGCWWAAPGLCSTCKAAGRG